MPTLRRGTILVLMAACTAALALFAKQNKDAQAAALLAKARELSDIRAAGSPAFLMRARVVAAPMGKERAQLDGTYVLTWASPGRWREQITFPGYQRVRVALRDKLWTASDLPFEPVRVYELSQLLDFRSHWTLLPGESAKVKRVRRHRRIESQCIEIKGNLAHGREVCAELPSLLPVRMNMLMPHDPLRMSFEYTDYRPAAGKEFPRMMRAYEGNKRVLEVRVEDLVRDPHPDNSVFVPPPQAVSRDWCSDALPATAAEKPAPRYPRSALSSRRQGVVSVYAVVGVDGFLYDLTVVRSAGQDFDAATLAGLARWRYHPAVCAGKPIPSEKVIQIAYTLEE